ncbi:hypothetical protein IT409_00740, partial [Candidatus Falkowbacteria bacterium]|nr:hypothetical protein [Candidatus Falkowbacteria bacterium]
HEAVAYHDRGAKSTALMSIGQAHEYRKTKKAFINYHSYKNHLAILYKNYSWQMLLIRFPHLALYEISKLLYLLFTEFSTLKSLREFCALVPVYKAKKRCRQVSSKISYRHMLKSMR